MPSGCSTLQRQGSKRYMDSGNKVTAFPDLLLTSAQSKKLSPTQEMVLSAVTDLGLHVDTASVFSMPSSEGTRRQGTYSMSNTQTSPVILFQSYPLR